MPSVAVTSATFRGIGDDQFSAGKFVYYKKDGKDSVRQGQFLRNYQGGKYHGNGS